MRLLSVRLIVSLIVGITLVSSGISYSEVLTEKRALRSDLERRAEMLGESLVGNVERAWNRGSDPERSEKELRRLVQRFGNREHMLGVVIYDTHGVLVATTPQLEKTLTASPTPVTLASAQGHEESSFVGLGGVPVHSLALPIRRQDELLGALAVVHDVSYIHAQTLLVWRQTFFRVLAQVFLIVLITLLIVRWSITGPIARAALWMRALRTGKVSFHQELPDLDIFRPLVREAATMAESLSHARNAAENEARLREAAESMWTADRLSVQLRTRLEDGHLLVVSNREPYMHQRSGKSLDVVVPPSGFVTALDEIQNVAKPVVLVQDYHFALLPRLLKEKRPDARVAIFWHIPWPNPEAFGICPWQRQLVDGLLGADLIGFHIQSHCNNFLETVDRVVESRIDWEHFSALRQDHRTIVRPFPIIVALTDHDATATHNRGSTYLERSALLRSLGVEATFIGIGVDRVDYTKGILERFLAIERFLHKYPSFQRKFTFLHIQPPTRTHINP